MSLLAKSVWVLVITLVGYLVPLLAKAQSWIDLERVYVQSSYVDRTKIFADLSLDLRLDGPMFDFARQQDVVAASYLRSVHKHIQADPQAARESAEQLLSWVRQSRSTLDPRLVLLTHFLAFEANRTRPGAVAEDITPFFNLTRAYCTEIERHMPGCSLIAAKYELRFLRSHFPRETGDNFLAQVIDVSGQHRSLSYEFERFYLEALVQFERRFQTHTHRPMTEAETEFLLSTITFFSQQGAMKHFSALVIAERYFRLFAQPRIHRQVLDALRVSLEHVDLPPAHHLRVIAELTLQYHAVVSAKFDLDAFNRLALEFQNARTIGLHYYEDDFYFGLLEYMMRLPPTGNCPGGMTKSACAAQTASYFYAILSNPEDDNSDEVAGILASILVDLLRIPAIQRRIDQRQYHFFLDVIILAANRLPGLEVHPLWPVIFREANTLTRPLVFREVMAALPPFVPGTRTKVVEAGQAFRAAILKIYDRELKAANGLPDDPNSRFAMFMETCTDCPDHLLWSRFVDAYLQTVSDEPGYGSHDLLEFSAVLNSGTSAFYRSTNYASALRVTEVAQLFHERFPELFTPDFTGSVTFRQANALAQMGLTREALAAYETNLNEIYSERRALAQNDQARAQQLLANEVATRLYFVNAKLSLPDATVAPDLQRLDELARLVPEVFERDFNGWLPMFKRTVELKRAVTVADWNAPAQVAALQRDFDQLGLDFARLFDPTARLTRDPLSKRVMKSILALAPRGALTDQALEQFVDPDLAQAERAYRQAQLATDFDQQDPRFARSMSFATSPQPQPELSPLFENIARQFRYLQEVDDNWLNAALGLLGRAGPDADRHRQDLLNLNRWDVLGDYDREVFVPAPKNRSLIQASRERLALNVTERRKAEILRDLNRALASDGFDEAVQVEQDSWGYKYAFTNSSVALHDLIGFDPATGKRDALLRSSEAVIVLRYIPDESRFVTFAASQDGSAKAVTDIAPDQLETLILNARRSVASHAEKVDLIALATLYQIAFGHPEIVRIVAGKNDWLVVPQGSLTRIPINVLIAEHPSDITSRSDYTAQNWLVFEKSVFMLPSVTALTLRDRKGQPTQTDAKKAVSVGNPYFGQQSILGNTCELAARASAPGGGQERSTTRADQASDFWRSVEPLPCSDDEADAISEILSANDWDVRTLTNRDATEAQLAKLDQDGDLTSAAIIHLATHSFFPKTRSRRFIPSILMSPFGSEGESLRNPPGPAELARSLNDHWRNDGYLSSHEILGLTLTAEMVILSACETMNRFGEESSGFSNFVSSFLFAGAQRLIVSQWIVADQATADLLVQTMSNRFGEHQDTWGDALTNAMRAMADGTLGVDDGLDRSHPYFWAPFQLIGVPQ